MSESATDLLIVLAPGANDEALTCIRSVAVVTQELLPRLVLVRANSVTIERIAAQRGVVEIYETPPSELPADLTPAERAFALAWAQRAAPKVRSADALAWDAPGFQPPDRTKKRRL